LLRYFLVCFSSFFGDKQEGGGRLGDKNRQKDQAKPQQVIRTTHAQVEALQEYLGCDIYLGNNGRAHTVVFDEGAKHTTFAELLQPTR
jgi:hypothetical protein